MTGPAELWRGLLRADRTTWVVFEHGTCVVLTTPSEDLTAQAISLLKDWPQAAGSYLGDFNVSKLDQDRGWLVTYSNPAILNHVAPAELRAANPSEVEVGITGRAKRGQDAVDLCAAHIEDRRRT